MKTGTEDHAVGATEPARDTIAPGTEIEQRYRVLERIGGGGMGTVYRVEHLHLRTNFALKVMRLDLADDPRMVQRFERESRGAASVLSEHVVPIVDSGALPDGTPYFVMQLLVGQDLRALLRELGPLPPMRAANLAIDACYGLSAAHARGLVHRDLKPANLFVTRGDDGRDLVKLLDFGIAKQGDDSTTRPGTLVGTARYMAPEQIGADVPVGPPTDLYALGVILYECISGAVPFDGDTTERVIYRIMTAEAVPLVERCTGLPAGLSDLVARALSKQPGERFADALELADALRPYAGRRGSAGNDVRLASTRSLTSHEETTLVEPVERNAIGSEGLSAVRSRGRISLLVVGSALVGASAGAAVVGVVVANRDRKGVVEESAVRPRPHATQEQRAAPAPARNTGPLPAPASGGPFDVVEGSTPASSSPPRVKGRPRLVSGVAKVPTKGSATPASNAATGIAAPPSTALDPRNPYAE